MERWRSVSLSTHCNLNPEAITSTIRARKRQTKIFVETLTWTFYFVPVSQKCMPTIVLCLSKSFFFRIRWRANRGNQYLNVEEREQARVLYKALRAAANAGEKSADKIIALVSNVISESPLAQIDYVEVVNAETLQPIHIIRSNSLLVLAVFFGKTRLIDNIRLG